MTSVNDSGKPDASVRPAPAVPRPTGDVQDGPHCSRCGHSLLGIAAGSRCPECGQVWKLRPVGTRDLFDLGSREIKGLRLSVGSVIVAWFGAFGFCIGLIKGFGQFALIVLTAVFAAGMVMAYVRMHDDLPGESMHALAEQFGTRIVKIRRVTMGYMLPAIGALSLLLMITTILLSAVLSGGFSDFGGWAVLVTTLVLMTLQAIACLKLAAVARLASDDRLAQTFWHLSWTYGLLAPFNSAFLGFAQWAVGTGQAIPTFCMGGYFLVIAAFVAEFWFGFAILRLFRSMNWAMQNRRSKQQREEAFRARFEAARADSSNHDSSPAFDRKPLRDVRLPR